MHEISKELEAIIAAEHGRTGWHDSLRLIEARDRIAELEAECKQWQACENARLLSEKIAATMAVVLT